MAASTTGGDPRLTLPPVEAQDVRPVVARGSTGPSGLVIGIAIAVLAILLFVILDSRRRALDLAQLPTPTRATSPGRDAPPLYIPPAPTPVATTPLTAPPPSGPISFVLPQPPVGPPRTIYIPQPMPQPVYPQPQLPPPPIGPSQVEQRNASSPALVIDLSGPQGADGSAPGPATGIVGDGGGNPRFLPGADGTRATQSTARATATMLVNRATTVPQGTLIPAVLETALDSNRAGFARAIVSRDVRGFDGTRVLVPRGSRLVGEYAANIAPGQNRAVITWTRLVRPDGVAIAIASPAADPLGRGGVRGQVNTHFLSRLGTAILQSALDVGVNLARPAGNSVVLGLQQNGGGLLGGQNQQPQPTLTVRAGTSITIFVARDLDFTGVGNPR